MKRLRIRGVGAEGRAATFDVNIATVYYHTSPDRRRAVQDLARKRTQDDPKQSEHVARWMKTRREKDPEFREWARQRSLAYNRAHRPAPRREAA
jgi:hypothetical protein